MVIQVAWYTCCMGDDGKYYFVLGGIDAEMEQIRLILEQQGIMYYQPQEHWGTITVNEVEILNHVQDDNPEARLEKLILVFVECRPDWVEEDQYDVFGYDGGKEYRSGDLVIIDHHNDWRDKPASLLQVCELLHTEPSETQQLIASIDSDFLKVTIDRWPEKADEIIEIWETGYAQAFPNQQTYEDFKTQCLRRFWYAAQRMEDELLVMDQVPQSMTMLAALANLNGLDCALCLGTWESANEKPCFFQGPPDLVEALAKCNWIKQYWGRRYLGCRAVPGEFLAVVRELRK